MSRSDLIEVSYPAELVFTGRDKKEVDEGGPQGVDVGDIKMGKLKSGKQNDK